jgi:hypothetical protein
MLTLSDVQNRRTADADIGVSDRMAALEKPYAPPPVWRGQKDLRHCPRFGGNVARTPPGPQKIKRSFGRPI